MPGNDGAPGPIRDRGRLELAGDSVFREWHGPFFDEMPRSLERSPDSRFLLSLGQDAQLWDTRAGNHLSTIPIPASQVKTAFFTPDSKGLICSSFGHPAVCRQLESNDEDMRALTGGPERIVASKGILHQLIHGGQTWAMRNQQIELWENGRPEQSRKIGPFEYPHLVTLSGDGNWAAAAIHGSLDRIHVWETATGNSVTNLVAPQAHRAWFSPDNKWLIASGKGGYHVWETGTWRPGPAWEANLDSGSMASSGDITFSTDGRLMAARQDAETFRLFRFPACSELVTLKPPLTFGAARACLCGDGSRLWIVGAGHRLFEWNLAQLRLELEKLGLDWL